MDFGSVKLPENNSWWQGEQREHLIAVLPHLPHRKAANCASFVEQKLMTTLGADINCPFVQQLNVSLVVNPFKKVEWKVNPLPWNPLPQFPNKN